jgi:hypothetical protein
MRAVVRFWVSVISLLVSVSTVGYLFVSFLFPDTAVVFQTRTARLAVLFVALLGTGTLVWSRVLTDRANAPAASDNRNR